MSLKFSDALRLSWTSISAHKVRSTLVIITISVFFILILGLNLVFQGVENTVLDAATIGSHGKIYIETGFTSDTLSNNPDLSVLPTNAENIIEQRLARYHGTKVGNLTFYHFENITVENPGTSNKIIYHIPDWHEVIDASAVTNLLTTPLSDVPASKVPVIVQQGKSLTEEQSETFFIVGYFPLSQSVNLRLPGGFNPLNFVLNDAGGRTDATFLNDLLLVDDGRESLKTFLADRTAKMEQEAEAASESALFYKVSPAIQTFIIATFDKASDAAEYYLNMSREGSEFGYACDYNHGYYCQARDLFGNAVSVASSFYRSNLILLFLGIVLFLIAACVAATTLAHVVSEDAATVALYRSLGATTKDIYLIYLLYLLELCFIAVVVCFLASLFFAGIMTLTSASALGAVLQKAYYLSEVPPISMLGFNPQFFLVLGSILLIAPLSLLLTIKSFSPKAIAKKLKAD